MRLSKIERTILKDLFKASEGLFIFTLYSRYKQSPRVLFESINKLEKEGILELIEDRVSLTKEGIEFAIMQRLNHIAEKNASLSIPQNVIGMKIEINSFYIPKDFKQ